MTRINRKKLLELIRENKSNIFSVVFLKKDGTIRRMICRLGVKKYVNGKGLKYDPIERGLLGVFDMQKEAYRMVNLNTISNIKMKGVEYYVEG